MRLFNISALLLLGLGLVLMVSSDDDGGTSRRSSLSKLSYTNWINLLRYAHKTLQREEPSNHTVHLDRASHIQLIAQRIKKDFFNTPFRLVHTEDGVEFVTYRHPVDFLILLDSSASVGSTNFDKTIRILTALIEVLDDEAFTEDKIRVAMISFSEPDKVEHEFQFSSHQSKQDIINQINSTQYHSGSSTSTAQALWMADSVFSRHSRSNTTRVMLLATDGWSQNELQLPFGVLWPAARLRKLHAVQSYVIGIGNQINHNELVAVASRPTDKHLFEVDDYDMMLEIVERIREITAPSHD